MNIAGFGKTMENVTKHIKLVTTEKRKNYLVLEPNYYAIKFFTEHLLTIETIKTEIPMSKLVYLAFAILELSKILTYQFSYDYAKPKYSKKAKLCYMDIDSFIWYLKTDDIDKDVAEDVEIIFDTSNYELEKPLRKGKS